MLTAGLVWEKRTRGVNAAKSRVFLDSCPFLQLAKQQWACIIRIKKRYFGGDILAIEEDGNADRKKLGAVPVCSSCDCVLRNFPLHAYLRCADRVSGL